MGGVTRKRAFATTSKQRTSLSCGLPSIFARAAGVSPPIATRGSRAAKADDEHRTNRFAEQPFGQEERCHTQTGQQLYAVDASLARRSRHAQLDLEADR